MSYSVEFFNVFDSGRMEEATDIRKSVFVDEQRVPQDEEFDAHDTVDSKAVHALVRNENHRAIAAGRYYTREDGAAQIGRMSVKASERNDGAGSLLLRALLADAKDHGFKRVVLHAQPHAIGFYRGIGFTEFGERFMDQGAPHVQMEKLF